MPTLSSPDDGRNDSANDSRHDSRDTLADLRRLVASRWIVLAAVLLLVLIAPGALDIPVRQEPLLAIVAIAAGLNAAAHWRLRRAEQASPAELFSQLLIDIATLGALVFFSGGATNPLVSLLLPTVAIAALTLPAPYVLGIGLVAVAAYSLLMLAYIPLPLPDAARATRLHLVGMWLTFAVSATLIAGFVVRMTRLIRQRDAELARAREQALRDERVMAIGTLAAGAAHELGTPLGTMALIAGELAHDFAGNPAVAQGVRDDIDLLRQQIANCKQIITGLSRRAGAERLENPPLSAADRWLDALRQHWHAVQPQVGSRLVVDGTGPAPAVVADPRLEQAVLNLLNNAARAGRGAELEIHLAWSASRWQIAVRDRGPGFPPSVLAQGGKTGFPAHAQGSGIGLMLTRSAIEQLGGRLELSNPADGGALARLDLPLPRP